MAIFSKKKTCPTCGNEYEGNGYSVAENVICENCFNKISLQDSWLIRSESDLVQHIKYRNENHLRLEAFAPTYSVETPTYLFYADDNSRQFYWLNAAQRRSLQNYGQYKDIPEPEVYSYDELLSYGYYENEGQIQAKGGVGRAVVGGLIAGEAGAIVGSVTGSKTTRSVVSSMMVTVVLDNPYRASYEFILKNSSSIRQGSGEYVRAKREADKIVGFFDHVSGDTSPIENNEPAPTSGVSESISDEIVKLKNLMDQGILTEDEFAEAKRRLISKI